MDTSRIILTLWLIAAVSAVAGHNITDILSEFPEYTVFNNYLTRTRLNDEINSRETLTVLVLNNSVLNKLLGNQPISVVKSTLSIHVLLDYFDITKLLTIGGGSMISTTLYQTTGQAPGGTGFVNITDLKDGKVEFRSTYSGSKIESLYTKTVRQFPYNISVLEISSPVIAEGILKAPEAVNISSLLEMAGCRTFAKLITDTGVLKVYESVMGDGLTVFAPSDVAFKAAGLPNLNKLTNAELVSVLLYHAISSYIPQISLKNEKNPLTTIATNSAGDYDFTVRYAGDSVTLNSGVDVSRVVYTVIDSIPLSIFTIDHVLLPMEIFSESPSPAAAPWSPTYAPMLAPETSTTSTPPPAPASRPIASASSPEPVAAPSFPPPAPPTPATSSPDAGLAPADNPAADLGNGIASSVGRINVPVIFLITAAISGIISIVA